MTDYRPLTEEETTLVQKQLRGLQEENDYLHYLLEDYDLKLSKGIRLNYLRTIKEYQQKRREANNRLNDININRLTLEEQLKKGVKKKKH